jgi:hypothetical protein
MATDITSLRDLLEKTPDADLLLREIVDFAAERLMELDVGAATVAALGETDPSRLARRKGFRDRDWVEEGQGMVRGPSPRRGSN